MPPKLPVFLLCSVAITLVIDTKAFPCHRKAKISLYCIELQKTRNKLVSTSLQDIVVKQKVSLFIPAPWFHRKNSQPSMTDDHDHILGSILRFTSGKVYYRPFEDGDQVNKCEFQFECLQISRNCAYMLSTKLLHWRRCFTPCETAFEKKRTVVLLSSIHCIIIFA